MFIAYKCLLLIIKKTNFYHKKTNQIAVGQIECLIKAVVSKKKKDKKGSPEIKFSSTQFHIKR